jgi:hypothetical protein
MGPDVPSELATYVASLPGGGSCVSAVLYYLDGTNYRWEALCEFGPTVLNVLRGATLNGSVEHFETEDFQLTGTTVGLFYGQGSMMDTFRLGTAALGLKIDYPASEVTLAGDVIYDGHTIVNNESFTPTLTQSGGNPGAGFATITGRYTKIGANYLFWIRIEVIDATQVGTGPYVLSLPFDLNFDTQVAVASAVDASTGLRHPCVADLDSSGTGTLDLRQASGATVTGTSPFAVANGDQYVVQGWAIAVP